MREFLSQRKWNFIGATLAILLGATFIYGDRTVFRPKRNQNNCQSNLKQIGIGFMQYTRDYDECGPLTRNWHDALMPYIKNETVFHCAERGVSFNSYAYHKRIADRKKFSAIKNPHLEVLAFESDANKLNASDYGMSLAKTARHPKGNSFLYADAHVKMRAVVGFQSDFSRFEKHWHSQDVQEIKDNTSFTTREKDERIGWIARK